MKNRILTISREFGSGGRTIGKMAAKEMGIPCYDSELIQRIAEESGFDETYVKNAEETAPAGFKALAFSTRAFGPTNDDYLWDIQRKVILELAEKGPCVIVGRCADYILRDQADCLTAFIHASLEFRAERIVKVYGEREAPQTAHQRQGQKARRLSSVLYGHEMGVCKELPGVLRQRKAWTGAVCGNLKTFVLKPFWQR